MTDYEASSLLALGLGSIFIFLLLMIVPYILGAIGLYKMAKRDQVKNEWLAFIPIGNTYVLGELIDEKLKWFTVGSSGGIKLLIISLGSIILSLVPIIGVIVSFLMGIFGFILLHWLYERYSDNPLLMTIITVITGGLAAFIIIFVLRERDPKY